MSGQPSPLNPGLLDLAFERCRRQLETLLWVNQQRQGHIQHIPRGSRCYRRCTGGVLMRKEQRGPPPPHSHTIIKTKPPTSFGHRECVCCPGTFLVSQLPRVPLQWSLSQLYTYCAGAMIRPPGDIDVTNPTAATHGKIFIALFACGDCSIMTYLTISAPVEEVPYSRHRQI